MTSNCPASRTGSIKVLIAVSGTDTSPARTLYQRQLKFAVEGSHLKVLRPGVVSVNDLDPRPGTGEGPEAPWQGRDARRGRFGLVALGNCWSIGRAKTLPGRSRDYLSLALWAGVAWVLLTWTASVEQAVYGVVVSVAVALILWPLGPPARPWRLLRPRRLVRLGALAGTSAARIVWANLVLARRVWSPSRPIRTGMLVVPTTVRSDGAVTVIGLLGSIIVDHQLVDLEPGRLHYHAVWVASEDPIEARERINGRLERLLQPFDEEANRE